MARIRQLEAVRDEQTHCLKSALDQLKPDEFYERVERAIATGGGDMRDCDSPFLFSGGS